jgi:hypothetical protein
MKRIITALGVTELRKVAYPLFGVLSAFKRYGRQTDQNILIAFSKLSLHLYSLASKPTPFGMSLDSGLYMLR